MEAGASCLEHRMNNFQVFCSSTGTNAGRKCTNCSLDALPPCNCPGTVQVTGPRAAGHKVDNTTDDDAEPGVRKAFPVLF